MDSIRHARDRYQYTAVAEVDPTTGLPRLIFGNSQGVWSVLDNNGTFETTIGNSDATPDTNRNGNLQLAHFMVWPSPAPTRPPRSPMRCSTVPPRTTVVRSPTQP